MKAKVHFFRSSRKLTNLGSSKRKKTQIFKIKNKKRNIIMNWKLSRDTMNNFMTINQTNKLNKFLETQITYIVLRRWKILINLSFVLTFKINNKKIFPQRKIQSSAMNYIKCLKKKWYQPFTKFQKTHLIVKVHCDTKVRQDVTRKEN